ncbi:acyl-CoA thioesterase [Novosphingobium sp. 9U]|uniref:acyl-CoA thioesterase n=1 Tax=Novosphingobium sp. 9U TaxID=2653158 RepID=UPI0012F1FEE1|nr:Thioesterase [Novosphingobium sp. 9U]
MPFTLTFTAQPEHIDRMGHVNNAVWVQWMEALATAHWEAVASPEHQAAYAWLVVRHEIDYRGNIREGEAAVATTWVAAPPEGARFERGYEFRNEAGKLLVTARTQWAILDLASQRIMRVPAEVAEPFLRET